MKKMISLLLVAAMAVGLCSCGTTATAADGSAAPDTEKTAAQSYTFAGSAPAESALYVEPIEGITDAFIRGADVSSYLAEKESGVVYKDFEGNELDDAGFFNLLAASGVNWVRIRIWNDPADRDGKTYGGGHNDLETAKAIGKLATDAGLKVLIDCHYSDFWADPAKQMAPKEWAHLTFEDKTAAMQSFTTDSLTALLDAGVDVCMVQIGNETNNGMAGETEPERQFALMKTGSEAARAVAKAQNKDIKLAVHFTNADKFGFADYCGQLIDAGVDFDVFAASYYPYWHGTTENLTAVLTDIATTYDTQVMVAETSYPFTLEDGDGFGNSLGEGTSGVVYNYDISEQGQANELRDVFASTAAVGESALGVFYWEPAWVPVQHYNATDADAATVLAKNKELWEQYGSGWATSFAKTYDAKDAGDGYGGSSWDNQALFDFDGKAMDVLNIFRYIYSGTTAENTVVSVPDSELECGLGEALAMPETVTAVLTDGSTKQLPVAWETAETAAIDTAVAGEATVHGTAQDETGGETYDTICAVSVLKINFIKNAGFEDADMTPWKIEGGGVDREADNNKRTGEYSLKFWSESAVKYTVTQTLENLPEGTYNYSTWLQGGDAGSSAVFEAFITVNGEEQKAAVGVTSWQNWAEAAVNGVAVPEGAEVVVGVRATAAAKAWGAWDDFSLTLAD